jgi:hypothetical protein
MDRRYLFALSVGCVLAVALAAVSVRLEWSAGAIYGAFGAIAAIMVAILTGTRPRTPGGRRG